MTILNHITYGLQIELVVAIGTALFLLETDLPERFTVYHRWIHYGSIAYAFLSFMFWISMIGAVNIFPDTEIPAAEKYRMAIFAPVISLVAPAFVLYYRKFKWPKEQLHTEDHTAADSEFQFFLALGALSSSLFGLYVILLVLGVLKPSSNIIFAGIVYALFDAIPEYTYFKPPFSPIPFLLLGLGFLLLAGYLVLKRHRLANRITSKDPLGLFK